MKDEGKSAGMAEVFRFVQAAAGCLRVAETMGGIKLWIGLA
jgi:hypothetical protein